jgi:hypothetical protein
MLWQLHHQYKDGRTEFCAQTEVFDSTPMAEVHEFTRKNMEQFPPPEGAQFLMLNEKHERFVWAVANNNICGRGEHRC